MSHGHPKLQECGSVWKTSKMQTTSANYSLSIGLVEGCFYPIFRNLKSNYSLKWDAYFFLPKKASVQGKVVGGIQ